MTDCSDNYSQTSPQLSILVCLPKLPHSPLASIPFQPCGSRYHLIYSFSGLFFLNSTLLRPTCRTSTWWIEWTCDRLCSCSSAGLWKKNLQSFNTTMAKRSWQEKASNKVSTATGQLLTEEEFDQISGALQGFISTAGASSAWHSQRITPSTNVLEQRCTRLSMSGLPSL